MVNGPDAAGKQISSPRSGYLLGLCPVIPNFGPDMLVGRAVCRTA